MVKKVLTDDDCFEYNKVLNTRTQRCNKPQPVKKILTDMDCFDIGKVLNTRTNRCNKIKPDKKILTQEDCFKIGKFLNIRTNRCNKKASIYSPSRSQLRSNSLKKSVTPIKMSSSLSVRAKKPNTKKLLKTKRLPKKKKQSSIMEMFSALSSKPKKTESPIQVQSLKQPIKPKKTVRYVEPKTSKKSVRSIGLSPITVISPVNDVVFSRKKSMKSKRSRKTVVPMKAISPVNDIVFSRKKSMKSKRSRKTVVPMKAISPVNDVVVSRKKSMKSKRSRKTVVPMKAISPVNDVVVSPKKSTSPNKKLSSAKMFSSRARKIDEFVKNRAKKLIQKLTMPFINRISVNIDDRIKTYQLYNKYFANFDISQCLKISKENGVLNYSLANDNIKFTKRIGTASIHAAIYLGKGINTGELFRFASKIMPLQRFNLLEINILKALTKIVIAKENPHFPIMYYNYICRKPEYNNDLPALINEKMYYVNFNELANGDVNTFIHEHHKNDNLIRNALAQIFISIYSFHCFGYFHNDTHWGNFLYHRIKPGGYVKYVINGKELYIENLGYLWIIWDFSFATKMPTNNNNMKQTTAGYNRILKAFMNKNALGWLSNKYPLSQSIVSLAEQNSKIILECNRKIPNIDNSHFVFFDKFIEINNLFIKKERLPKDAIIINKNNPYRIGY
jgi:hypothetical protein